MKKDISKKLILTLLIIFSMLTVNCKKGDKEFDITDASWAFYLVLPDGSTAVIYAFRGALEQGDVLFNNEVRGTYTVNNTIVTFTVNHFDNESNTYIYAYIGSVVDYYNMGGTLTVTFPDSTTVNGTWTAER